jgi:Ca-activated chloride channel family protein
MRLGALAAGALLFAAILPARAQDTCTQDAMIVFDGSGSMAEMGFNLMDEPRIFEARRALAQVMPEIAQMRNLGLMIYGPGGFDGCTGIDLRFPPMPDAAGEIIAAVNGLQPDGDTPLTQAVGNAVGVLLASSGQGEVVLVTDGKETCGGTPCQMAADLVGQGITLHVIGFKVRGDKFAWDDQAGAEYRNAEAVSRCMADLTGGLYVGAETVDDLVAALRKTLGCNVLF